MKTLLLVLALLLAGCGGSSDFSEISGQPVSANAAANRRLDGVWGGFFPDHQPGQDRGLEVQFERTEREAVILRAGGPERHEMDLEQNGKDVRIELSHTLNPRDRSIFTGRLVDSTTIRGEFVNESRGEDFPLELKRSPNSDQLLPPVAPVSAPQRSVAGQAANTYEAIAMSAKATDGTVYKFLTHPGYPGGYEATLPTGETAQGQFYMTPLNLFDAWTEFEFYGPSHYNGTIWLYRDTWYEIGYDLVRISDSDNKSYWYTDYQNNEYTYLNSVEMQVVPSNTFDVGYYLAPYTPQSPYVDYVNLDEVLLRVTRVVAQYLTAYRQ